MVGADKIMNSDVLQKFALDKQPAEALPISKAAAPVDMLERVRRLFPALARSSSTCNAVYSRHIGNDAGREMKRDTQEACI